MMAIFWIFLYLVVCFILLGILPPILFSWRIWLAKKIDALFAPKTDEMTRVADRMLSDYRIKRKVARDRENLEKAVKNLGIAPPKN